MFLIWLLLLVAIIVDGQVVWTNPSQALMDNAWVLFELDYRNTVADSVTYPPLQNIRLSLELSMDGKTNYLTVTSKVPDVWQPPSLSQEDAMALLNDPGWTQKVYMLQLKRVRDQETVELQKTILYLFQLVLGNSTLTRSDVSMMLAKQFQDAKFDATFV